MDLLNHLYVVVLLYLSRGSYSILANNLKEFLGSNLDQYIFTSKATGDAYLPEIGNGHIATQIRNKCLFMNGIYNGARIDSHRACIPSTVNWNVSSTDNLQQSFDSLNSVIGIFEEVSMYNDYNISMSTYVSRVSRQIVVRNISLEMFNRPQSVILNIVGTIFDRLSPDFNFSIQDIGNAFLIKGNTKIPENEHTRTLPIFVILEKVPVQIILNNSNPWISFITSLDEVERNALDAYKQAMSTKSLLLTAHSQGWIDTWDDGLIRVISNNSFVSRSVHAAQYYLLSSLPNRNWALNDQSWLFYGLSPTGLAHGNTLDDYLGHVFWDMDTWMFPAILPFHNSLAIELIKYRRVMLNAALDGSRISGYKGARYPWESARTGYETTYDPIVGQNEIHITSDISFAIQQLLFMNSKYRPQLYYNLGKDIIFNIARFWASRVSYNETIGKYEIYDVMPPDEYVNSCNNSAFTNIAAMKSLAAPLLLAKRYNDTVTDDMLAWSAISNNIVVPYDDKLDLILEYDGFKLGTKVKQADVVLLQYPLQFNMDRQCVINNLNYYGQATDVNGPAMTWAIFSINWFSLNESGKAEQYFIKNFDYITSPYYVWSEMIDGKGAKNFITGIGGYLQNILYGYMGMRLEFIDDGQLIFNPTITSLINGITLHNVTFQNSNLDITVDDLSMSIQLLNKGPIYVFASKDQNKYTLTNLDNKIHISNQKVVITSA